jgi:hypothetical protein
MHGPLLVWAVALAFAALAYGDAGGSPDTAAQAAPTDTVETIVVNLSVDLGPPTYRASGFLHGMTATEPEQALVEPLRPKLFRSAEDRAFAIYERAKGLGARSQLVVSDSYWDRKWPETASNWKRWEATVEDMVERAKTNGYTMEWDIWNEPEDGWFWEVDQAKFFEAWRRTVLTIRALDSKAVIVGPTLATYDGTYLEEFLVYAKANHVLPDILCWHELDDAGARDLPAHAADARRLLTKHDIGITRLCINEIIGRNLHTWPGAAVRFFAALERAEVDGACHATWGDKDDGYNPSSLSGILTQREKLPRSTWWAYKGYADVTGRLVSVQPSATVDGVAGYDADAKEARVVLGRMAGDTAAGAVELRLLDLAGASGLVLDGETHVTAQRIPMSGWESLACPVAVLDAEYQVREGRVTLALPEFGPNDAYLITVRAPRA